MNRIEPRTLPGFMELSPNDQVKFNQMIDTIRKSYENFGFDVHQGYGLTETSPVIAGENSFNKRSC